ncbi:hypothetical protein N8797_00830 [Pontimonas sp.]|nr:hypothetical protein [Pontimonas sp.]
MRVLFMSAAAVLLGALAGGIWGNTDVSLETVIYSWQETEAELFVTDEFGTFSDFPTTTRFVDMGSNRVSFSLTEDYQRRAVIQRLDPCNCPWGISVGRIGLASPFAYEGLQTEYWSPGGSNQRLIADTNMQLIENRAPEVDPQIVFSLDIARFIQRSTVLGALTGAVFAGATLGLVRLVSFRLRPKSVSIGDSLRPPSTWTSPAKLPAFVGWGAGVLILGAVVQVVAGSLSTGVTIDEGYHVGHLQNFLEGGDYSSASYGPAAALVGHAVNVVLGNETWGLVTSTAEAFGGRHLAMALLGILAIAAVGLTLGVAFGSWSWGLLCAALLASVPLWVGHSMFNIKDVPAGAGYAVFTAGLAVLIVNRLGLVSRLGLGFLLVAAGTLLSVGTRPGLWPLMLATAISALVVWSLGQFFERSLLLRADKFRIVIKVMAGVFVFLALILLLLFFTDVGRDFADSVTRSLNHPWSKSRRYAGLRVYNRPEAFLVFQILLSQLPLALSALFLVGTATGLVLWAQDIRRGQSISALSRVFAISAVPLFAPFFVIAVFSPVLYDGIRQILFVLPGLAVIAGIGVWGALNVTLWLFGSRRSVKLLFGMTLAVILSLTTIDQIRLFPYNYTYVNPLAQGSGVSGAWETDYWDSSMREAIVDEVAVGDPTTCGFTHKTFWNIGELRPPCVAVAPYLDSLAPASDSILGPREFWTVRSERDLLQYGPPPFNCFPESSVSRTLRSETLVMSRLYRCIDN